MDKSGDMRNWFVTPRAAWALRMWRGMLTVTSSSFPYLSLGSRGSCIPSSPLSQAPSLCHLHHHQVCTEVMLWALASIFVNALSLFLLALSLSLFSPIASSSWRQIFSNCQSLIPCGGPASRYRKQCLLPRRTQIASNASWSLQCCLVPLCPITDPLFSWNRPFSLPQHYPCFLKCTSFLPQLLQLTLPASFTHRLDPRHVPEGHYVLNSFFQAFFSVPRLVDRAKAGQKNMSHRK